MKWVIFISLREWIDVINNIYLFMYIQIYVNKR